MNGQMETIYLVKNLVNMVEQDHGRGLGLLQVDN